MIFIVVWLLQAQTLMLLFVDYFFFIGTSMCSNAAAVIDAVDEIDAHLSRALFFSLSCSLVRVKAYSNRGHTAQYARDSSGGNFPDSLMEWNQNPLRDRFVSDSDLVTVMDEHFMIRCVWLGFDYEKKRWPVSIELGSIGPIIFIPFTQKRSMWNAQNTLWIHPPVTASLTSPYN